MMFDSLYLAYLALLHQDQNLYRMKLDPSNICCLLGHDKKLNQIIFDAPNILYIVQWVIIENVIRLYYICCAHVALFC
jgi:hypothetical protein